MLSFIDLLQVIFYPFLLWAAWLLHRRNSRDVVSSILSLAVLLSIGAEQPSTIVLAAIGVPRWLVVALFDLGNMLLLAGILLFPHGYLSWRKVALIACLPLLTFLHDDAYKAYFVGFMIIGVLVMIRCLRRTKSSEQRQQIRWALLGISAYALLRCLAIAGDYLKWSTGSFGQQLLVEMGPGISFALAALFLQLGLLIALLRYRLYDAEIAIGRSVNFAVITLGVAAVFAAAGDALKQVVYNYSGNTSNEGPIIFAAALATIMVNPIQERVQRWSEKRFQKHLFLLRNDLPQSVRDLRETASLDEMVGEILAQVDRGVRAVCSAMIVNGCVLTVRGIGRDEVEVWRTSVFAQDYKSDICEASIKSSRSGSRSSRAPTRRSPSAICSSALAPTVRSPAATSRRRSPRCPKRSLARSVRSIKREARKSEVTELIADNIRRIEALEALLGGGRAPGKGSRRTA